MVKKEWLSQEMEKIPLKQKEKSLEKKNKFKRSREDDFINDQPSTSTAQNSSVGIGRERSKRLEIICISDSANEVSDNENSLPWTNLHDVPKLKQKYKCSYCDKAFEKRNILVLHVRTTCLVNPDSKINKETSKYKCGCGRSYKESKTLRYHQKHECNRKITCEYCGVTMIGTSIPERHKQKCVNKQRTIITEKIKQESPDELFIDDSSIDYSD